MPAAKPTRISKAAAARKKKGLKEIRVWVPNKPSSIALVRRLAEVMRDEPDIQIKISRLHEPG